MGCDFSKVGVGPPPASLLYCRLPEGVHSHMLEHVDLKKLTKLIKTGRLAPLYPHELAQQDVAEECPICTVSYPSMNTASCCSARVCTECFVHHQTASDPPGKAQCPFCKSTPFAVRYLGSKSREQLQQERLEQQQWKQARQRLQHQQDWPLTDNPAGPSSTSSNATHAQQQQQQEQPEGSSSWQNQQQQQQQQQHRWQRSWLDQLSSPSRAAGSGSSRTVEAANVFAGYHLRTSSSSGGVDTGLLLDTAAAAAERDHDDDDSSSESFSETASVAAAVEAALAAAAAEAAASEEGDEVEHHAAAGGLGLQQQLQEQQQQEQQQQEQAYLAANVLELQMQQLNELQLLHEAGLLPGYAAAELSGLRLDELDEILLEQAVLESLQAGTAGTECS